MLPVLVWDSSWQYELLCTALQTVSSTWNDFTSSPSMTLGNQPCHLLIVWTSPGALLYLLHIVHIWGLQVHLKCPCIMHFPLHSDKFQSPSLVSTLLSEPPGTLMNIHMWLDTWGNERPDSVWLSSYEIIVIIWE